MAATGMFEAVIFDWDGTLAETKDVIMASFHKALNESSIDVDEEFIKRLMGKSAKEIFSKILEDSEIPFDEEIVNDLVEKRINAELELSNRVKLKDGALELLDTLKGRVKLALASMNNKQVIDRMLTCCGLNKFFDVVLSADEVSEPKPNPEIFLKCASELGLKPDAIVVIEDSMFGVKAAKAAKMNCIVVLSEVSSVEEIEKEKPDLIVASLKEKASIVKFILS